VETIFLEIQYHVHGIWEWRN